MSGPQYDAAQAKTIRESYLAGEAPACPVCERAMARTGVEPSDQVSYVRVRDWLLCPRCKRSLVVDRPRSGGHSG